ncbi:MAG TPA: hypothetical protein VMX17_12620 [Candidatus Glassbacteria bacterium]|nr:hypothetical protein [Candidatus Glassbacteria bacterium]
MTKSTDIENLTKRIEFLEARVKSYDRFFASWYKDLEKDVGKFKMNSIDNDDVAVAVDEDIKKAGGFKETTVGDEPAADKYNDPVVMKDPPRWSKKSFVGRKYSECTPEYLLDLAGFLEWAASDDKKNNIMTSTGKPRYPYRERDAKRAKDWAVKLRDQPKEILAETVELPQYDFKEVAE